MLIYISMFYRTVVILVNQMLAYKLCKGDRAVLAAGTAYRNYKLALALFRVKRNGAVDKGKQAGQKLLAVFAVHYIVPDLFIKPCFFL